MRPLSSPARACASAWAGSSGWFRAGAMRSALPRGSTASINPLRSQFLPMAMPVCGAIHRQVATHAEHRLDWFHIAMRFADLRQLAKGINAEVNGMARSHAPAEIELVERGIAGLAHALVSLGFAPIPP